MEAMARSKVGQTVETLGEYLHEQRLAAQLSLRQLAEQTGVSNPYLSQIERGLRRPSAEVLSSLAKALRISAEQLYAQAGLISPDEGTVRSVELAILADPVLTRQQKQSLLDVYQAFRAVTEGAVAPSLVEDLVRMAPEHDPRTDSGPTPTDGADDHEQAAHVLVGGRTSTEGS